jgi:hypothetical protein
MRNYASFLVLCAAATALAQSIADVDSSFTLPAANTAGSAIRTGTSGGSAAGLIAGGDATDQLFQHWWWYRVSGVNTREFAFSNRTSNNAGGNEMILTYVEPEGFDASIRYQITDGVNMPATCQVRAELTLRNTTAGTLNLALYCYLDLDLEGVSTDAAVRIGPGLMRVTDQSSGFFCEFLGEAAGVYQVSLFPVLRNQLADGDVDNLNNSGLPYPAADFSAAYQWNLVLPPNTPVIVRAAFFLNLCGGPRAGDVDGDWDVDLTDLSTLLTNFGVSGNATRTMGDLDGDMDVDLADLSTLLTTFGATCS